jgi:hypothetical protein
MKKKKPKLGDIIAIPLPDGSYAFGRLYKEGTLAIFKERAKDINEIPDEIPEKNGYEFFVTVYRDLLSDGQWTVVGNIPFDNDDDAWRPPSYIKDALNGNFSIYEHGEIRPASEQQCKGLEATAVWDRNHLVDRLMGNDKWTMIC